MQAKDTPFPSQKYRFSKLGEIKTSTPDGAPAPLRAGRIVVDEFTRVFAVGEDEAEALIYIGFSIVLRINFFT